MSLVGYQRQHGNQNLYRRHYELRSIVYETLGVAQNESFLLLLVLTSNLASLPVERHAISIPLIE